MRRAVALLFAIALRVGAKTLRADSLSALHFVSGNPAGRGSGGATNRCEAAPDLQRIPLNSLRVNCTSRGLAAGSSQRRIVSSSP